MVWICSVDVSRAAKEERRQAKKAQREQVKRNQELARKGLISGPPRLTILDTKTLSQTDAATLLDCAIDQWQRESRLGN